MKTIFLHFDQKSSIFIFFIRVRRICSKFSFKFHKISSKMTFSSFFHETLLESLRDSHSPGQEFHFFDSKITHFQFFHTCTAFWLQKFITKSQNGVQRSHLGLKSGHRRARPARPAGSEVVPDEPGRLARPARPPGPRLAGRWAASREGNEGRAQEGAQRAGDDGAPPLLSPQVGYLVRIQASRTYRRVL